MLSLKNTDQEWFVNISSPGSEKRKSKLRVNLKNAGDNEGAILSHKRTDIHPCCLMDPLQVKLHALSLVSKGLFFR